MSNLNLFFYSDASEWGGHEALSARIASVLAETEQWSVNFIFHNETFATRLHPSIRQIRLPYCHGTPFPIIKDRSGLKRNMALEILRKEKPKYVICCAGNIERCLPMAFAAKQLGIPLVNYIPMAYTQCETKATLGWIRDLLAAPIYSLYAQWIVISDAQERLLRRFVQEGTLVHQIPIPLTGGEECVAKRPKSALHLATIGRIYFDQKGQDSIPPIARKLRERGVSVKFTVLGNGPHEKMLSRMVQKDNLEDYIQIKKWISPEEVRQAMKSEFDALFIPSHFEGGPTVLFEAFECGIPIIVANAGYIVDYRLPSWMIYDPTDLGDAARKITDMPKSWNEIEFNECRQRIFANRRDAAFNETVNRVFSEIHGKMGY